MVGFFPAPPDDGPTQNRPGAARNALDAAFRHAVGDRFPLLDAVRLTDYKVRIIDSGSGTGAVTRVLIDASNGEMHWSTIGVSENIIEASWQALVDAVEYKLHKEELPAGESGDS